MKERTLKDIFHRVKQVLPESQKLVTFHSEKTVSDALEEMRKGNFSQIPVVEGNEVLGVFSYRSFAEGIKRLPESERNLMFLPVEEFLEDLKYARITDELTVLIDEFDIKDGVLVGSENRLQGIITTIDALRYFYGVASPYVLLREIELAIRELIRVSVDNDELKDCIDKSLKKHYEGLGRPVPSCLEELSTNDYVTLLRFKGTWERFKVIFGGTSNIIYTKLKPLPELRNVVFHFRREITLEEYDSLRDVRDWLLKRIRKFEASRNNEQND